jgi:hypothetical protein
MKCQFVSHCSSLDGTRSTVSTSFLGVAALSESLVNDVNFSCFRVFIPRDDVLLGDWMTLWMAHDEGGCTVNCRSDYALILRILQSPANTATKYEQLRCCFVTSSDLRRKITGRI